MIPRRRLFALVLAAAFPLAAFPQAEIEFAEMIRDTQARIEGSLQQYQDFVEATQNEKLELITRINQLENELVKLRRAEAKATRSTTEQGLDLQELRSRIAALDTQAQYSAGVLSEYLTNFESRIHVSEDQIYLGPLREIRERLEEAGDSTDDRLPVFFEALDLGLARQEELVGGRLFEGKAITPTGGVKPGSIALIGPVAYFSSTDATAAGVLRFNSGTIEPGLAPLAPNQTANIRSTLQARSGPLAFDASLGNALVLDKARGTLLEHIAKGGWVGYAILLLGAAAIVIALLKFIDLRGVQVNEPDDLRGIARSALHESAEAAKIKLEPLRGPVRNMLSTGAEFARADTDTLLDSMEATILRFRPKLERFLPILATTAAVAPLMGLLGTVVGMIKTFTLIEVFGTGDAKSLSSGISEALVTTELGLVVAIPALVFHGIFTRIMRSRLASMEQIATDFSRHVAAQRQVERESVV